LNSAPAEVLKAVNERYHDAAADSYDAKWGIDFGETGQGQVSAKLCKALGHLHDAPFGDALEIGAGTGYFGLNLLQAGLIERATALDISPGMIYQLERNAAELGVKVKTAVADAESLPFESGSFDLVFGHAVLHHIPDLDQAFLEFVRLLRPGGVIAFCGEPSLYGDAMAELPKRAAKVAAPIWRHALRTSARRYPPPTPQPSGHEFEGDVDVHTFAPSDLGRLCRQAGLSRVRVRGEELLASIHGWTVRTLEGSADPAGIPFSWRLFAFRSYLALQQVDTRLLEPWLPPQLFYNLLVSARRPQMR
jgi:ubiquinone/menaquinone biosynthesis C-methylase UbiE